VTALVEHALVNGIFTYTGVADSGWMAQILTFGWDASPLGPFLPQGKELAALRIDITTETPSRLQQAGMWSPTPSMLADVAFA
jgi:N-acyl-L-homoserine lactone synthetase